MGRTHELSVHTGPIMPSPLLMPSHKVMPKLDSSCGNYFPTYQGLTIRDLRTYNLHDSTALPSLTLYFLEARPRRRRY
jgi:hypothetical protein